MSCQHTVRCLPNQSTEAGDWKTTCPSCKWKSYVKTQKLTNCIYLGRRKPLGRDLVTFIHPNFYHCTHRATKGFTTNTTLPVFYL